MTDDRCQYCGARADSDERQAAEIVLAQIMALLKQPAALAQFERVLRHLSSVRAGAARVIELDQERAARR